MTTFGYDNADLGLDEHDDTDRSIVYDEENVNATGWVTIINGTERRELEIVTQTIWELRIDLAFALRNDFDIASLTLDNYDDILPNAISVSHYTGNVPKIATLSYTIDVSLRTVELGVDVETIRPGDYASSWATEMTTMTYEEFAEWATL